jgi:hypothetical protein
MDATTRSTATGTTATSATTTDTPTAAQAAEQLKATLTAADSNANQQVQTLGQVHQARLAQANRTVTALTAQYGANDPRVKAAQAAVTATKTTIARVSMVSQQLAVPSVQVSATGWALQGRVLDAQLQPAAKFTVFLVDANKIFLEQYGFTYTDTTGYFLINYAGDSDQPPTKASATAVAAELYLEVANTDANPVYLSTIAFQPVLGTATFQNVVLPAGGQPIGDPPAAIRAVALPGKSTKAKSETKSSKKSKS